MSTKKKEQGLQLMSGSEAPDVMKMMEKELKELNAIETTKWKTGGSSSFRLSSGDTINIQTETDEAKLVNLYVHVKHSIKNQNEGYDELGITTHPLSLFQGQDLDAVVHDIKLNRRIHGTEARRKELQSIFEEAKQFISKEQQYNMFLERANKVLGKPVSSFEELGQ